jgi:hypothetical protein
MDMTCLAIVPRALADTIERGTLTFIADVEAWLAQVSG